MNVIATAKAEASKYQLIGLGSTPDADPVDVEAFFEAHYDDIVARLLEIDFETVQFVNTDYYLAHVALEDDGRVETVSIDLAGTKKAFYWNRDDHWATEPPALVAALNAKLQG